MSHTYTNQTLACVQSSSAAMACEQRGERSRRKAKALDWAGRASQTKAGSLTHHAARCRPSAPARARCGEERATSASAGGAGRRGGGVLGARAGPPRPPQPLGARWRQLASTGIHPLSLTYMHRAAARVTHATQARHTGMHCTEHCMAACASQRGVSVMERWGASLWSVVRGSVDSGGCLPPLTVASCAQGGAGWWRRGATTPYTPLVCLSV